MQFLNWQDSDLKIWKFQLIMNVCDTLRALFSPKTGETDKNKEKSKMIEEKWSNIAVCNINIKEWNDTVITFKAIKFISYAKSNQNIKSQIEKKPYLMF